MGFDRLCHCWRSILDFSLREETWKIANIVTILIPLAAILLMCSNERKSVRPFGRLPENATWRWERIYSFPVRKHQRLMAKYFAPPFGSAECRVARETWAFPHASICRNVCSNIRYDANQCEVSCTFFSLYVIIITMFDTYKI